MVFGPPRITNDESHALPSPVTMNHNLLAESPLHRKHVSDSPRTPPTTDELKTRRPELQMDSSPAGSQESIHAQRDGSSAPSPAGRRFIREMNADRSQSSSPFRLQMPYITPGQLAFSALQFLPVPVLVLNNLKTVVLANEAMGRLMGMSSDSGDGDDLARGVGSLTGQSLSQVGIDMLQNGRPIFIAWETFLDSIAEEMGPGQTQPANFQRQSSQGNHPEGDMTPIAESAGESAGDNKLPGHSPQAAVEVVISRRSPNKPVTEPQTVNRASDNQAFAKMIISVWDISEQQTYFTLTFTNTESTSSVGTKKKAIARASALESAERKTIFTASNPPSVASSHGSSSSPSYRISPGTISLSSSPFPPMGPPFQQKSLQNAPSMLQKTMILKDTLLDNTEMPILAMWKDGTVAFPNAAARRLMEKDATLDKPFDGLEVLSNWKLYTDDFSRELEPSEFPMGILLRTQTPFSDMRIGVIDRDGNKIRYNVLAEAIRDDETGEFLAGVISCRDVTEMAKEIDQIKARDVERFKIICDTMPQLVSTYRCSPRSNRQATCCSMIIISSLITEGRAFMFKLFQEAVRPQGMFLGFARQVSERRSALGPARLTFDSLRSLITVSLFPNPISIGRLDRYTLVANKHSGLDHDSGWLSRLFQYAMV